MKNFASRHIETLESETRFRLDQAAREARRMETALETWQMLFQECQYRKAQQWWNDEIRPDLTRN